MTIPHLIPFIIALVWILIPFKQVKTKYFLFFLIYAATAIFLLIDFFLLIHPAKIYLGQGFFLIISLLLFYFFYYWRNFFNISFRFIPQYFPQYFCYKSHFSILFNLWIYTSANVVNCTGLKNYQIKIIIIVPKTYSDQNKSYFPLSI